MKIILFDLMRDETKYMRSSKIKNGLFGHITKRTSEHIAGNLIENLEDSM